MSQVVQEPSHDSIMACRTGQRKLKREICEAEEHWRPWQDQIHPATSLPQSLSTTSKLQSLSWYGTFNPKLKDSNLQ